MALRPQERALFQLGHPEDFFHTVPAQVGLAQLRRQHGPPDHHETPGARSVEHEEQRLVYPLHGLRELPAREVDVNTPVHQNERRRRPKAQPTVQL